MPTGWLSSNRSEQVRASFDAAVAERRQGSPGLILRKAGGNALERGVRESRCRLRSHSAPIGAFDWVGPLCYK